MHAQADRAVLCLSVDLRTPVRVGRHRRQYGVRRAGIPLTTRPHETVKSIREARDTPEVATSYDATFLIGDVFPSDDPLARYVVRLSTALNDLRLAASPLLQSFDQTPDYVRMYQVRITAGHANELAQLVEPEGRSSLPTVDDLIATLGKVDPKIASDIGLARTEFVQALNTPLAHAQTTLRREINRLRQQAFHYGYKRGNDLALEKAMAAAADVESVYRVEAGQRHARYADEIAHQVMHPHKGSDAAQATRLSELHRALARLLPAASRLVLNVEVLWLGSRGEHLTIDRT